jgi:hypothetical protein
MNTQKDLVLVTGVTGHQGGAVANELLAKGVKVRGLTRKPESAAAKALAARGVEIVKGDLDDEASLKQALAGAWGAFSVQNTWEAGVEARRCRASASRSSRARRASATSSTRRSRRRTAPRAFPHFENKWRIEQTSATSASRRTPSFGPSSSWRTCWDRGSCPDPGRQARHRHEAGHGAADDRGQGHRQVRRVGVRAPRRISRREIDIAATSFTGPQAADVLTRVTKHPVEFVQVPIEQVRAGSDDFATMLEWFDSTGLRRRHRGDRARERHRAHDVRAVGDGAKLGAAVSSR